MKMKIITAKNIYKSYNKFEGKNVEVLKDINFELEKNLITVIVGASGAGKSTLMHILSGLDSPDSGSVLIDDIDVFNLNDDKLSELRNNKFGFVFQFHQLLPEFTAAENVAIPQMIKGISKKDALARADELLKEVGLADRLEHKPAELSGGEQQRIAVARALANNPEIIFADEPTGNLDSQNSEILHNLFIELKEKFGLTFLIVTHNPDLVNLSDAVYEMKDGTIYLKN